MQIKTTNSHIFLSGVQLIGDQVNIYKSNHLT